MSVEKNILEAIDTMVNKRIDSTPIDLTVTGKIARIHNAAIGEYKVTYQSNTFSAYSLDPLTVYRQGEEVYVLVPRGDFSSQKMILGKAAFNDKVSYADRQAMQNQWRTRGPNWLSPEWYWRKTDGNFRDADSFRDDFGICVTTNGEEAPITANAAWRRYIFYRPGILQNPQDIEGSGPGEYTNLRWSKTRWNGPQTFLPAGQEQLAKVDHDLQQWGAREEYIMVRADFKTLFTDTHISGEYGIRVECYVDNPRYGLEGYETEPEFLITKFDLSFCDFNGTRYSFPQPFPQQAVFKVPRGVIKGLVRVSVFQTNGWKTDITPNPLANHPDFNVVPSPVPPGNTASYVTDMDNVIASNIQIYWCEPVNLSERLFWIDIETLKGLSLYNTSNDSAAWIENIPVRAKLMYGNQNITDRENCKFVWFRQKYSALRSAAVEAPQDEYGNTWAGYLPEGENGWVPIDLLRGSYIGNPWQPGTTYQKGAQVRWGTPTQTYRCIVNTSIGVDPTTPNQKDWEFNPFAEHDPGSGANYEMGSFPSLTATSVNASDTFQEGLTIPINKVPWKWKYLVVCYYNPGGGDLASIVRSNQNDALVWETFEVTNASSIYDFEIPPAYAFNLSELYLRVRNNTLPWYQDTPADTFDPTIPDPDRDWWCRWWAAENATYTAMQNADYPRYIKGRRRVDHWVLNAPITFKAQVFGDKKSRPHPEDPVALEAAIRESARWGTVVPPGPDMADEYPQFELANVERAIVPDNDAAVHIQFHGDLNHYYNSDGTLRDFGSNAETQYNVWATITPRDDSVVIYSVNWLAPDQMPLNGTEKKAYTPSDNSGMTHFMWVSEPDKRRMLHYKVEQKYDVNKVQPENNTFWLRLDFVGSTEPLLVPCPIGFITADGNGANGTEWEAIIYPTNREPTLDGDMTVSHTPWTWDIQNHPRPLVVNGRFDNVGAHPANSDYKLYLRPFIRRKNVPIENLTEANRYTYKVYWDVRYPNVKADKYASLRARASNSSFLRLNQDFIGRNPAELGGDGGAGGTRWKPGTAVDAGTDIFQAYTHSRDQETIPYAGTGEPFNPANPPWMPTKPRTYGAIEVLWRGRSQITNDGFTVNFKQMNYSFFVRAQIDIFYDDKKVQTIYSFYGTDILFTNGVPINNPNVVIPSGSPDTRRFVPSKVKTTWPKEVKYTSTGLDPTSRTEILRFWYGDNINIPENAEPPFPMTARPINLTEEIQQLTIDERGLNPRGAYSSTLVYSRTGGNEDVADVVNFQGNFYKVRSIGSLPMGTAPDPSDKNDPNWIKIQDTTRWVLMPRPFYFFEQFDNGALATNITLDTGKWPPAAGHNPDFTTWTPTNGADPTAAYPATPIDGVDTQTYTFVRTIIYRLSQFGNDDVNAWDGKSIDINEENGTIFAPTLGAGWKHPFTNTFTGVIMGIDKSQLRNAYADNYGGFSGESVDQMKYMTGVFGYQDGVNSFGILENGTAFFGRADRGGRIIIDGFNAQIYGGVTVERDTGLGANMRNRMRLSFIDFGGAAATAAQLEDPSFLHGGVLRPPSSGRPPNAPASQTTLPTVGLSVDDMPGIQMDEFEVEQDQDWGLTPTANRWFGNFRNFFAPGIGIPGGAINSPGEDPWAFYYGGFATGHGFSTPAIEIGSYEDWVRGPDGKRIIENRSQWQLVLNANTGRMHPYRAGKQLIRRLTIEQVRKLGERDEIKLLEIPGFRRFLVTYDGTLYAMNAFIMGTIMGSNIIGSQFFTDTGAGVITNYILGFGLEGPSTYTAMNTGGIWSYETPTVYYPLTSSIFDGNPGTKAEFEQGGDGSPGSGFNFAVGVDGTVVANRLHMTGGSISIGTFHVIGKDNAAKNLNAGDVFSFGTIHLVGPNIDPTSGSPVTWDEGGTALEGWGNFYLRGTLVNLGRVYLGSTYEKTTEANGTYYSASSINAPISIEPTQPGVRWTNNRPYYPVTMGVWPFYFKIGNGGVEPNDSTNNTWVTMSTSDGVDNGYMPNFSRRPADVITEGFMTPAEGGKATLGKDVTWRLDQIGLWTDAILFTSRGTPFGVTISDTSPFSTRDHGLAYLGWWSQDGYTGHQLRLKNINAKAPSFTIETLRHVRFSSGKDWNQARNGPLDTGDDYNTMLLDVWRPSSNGTDPVDRGAAMILATRRGTPTEGLTSGILASSTVIGLEAYEENSTGQHGDGLQAFIHIGGLGVSTYSLRDEFGRTIGRIPRFSPENIGRIWIKSQGMAIDSATNDTDILNTTATATIRLNRSLTGLATSGGTEGMPDNMGDRASIAISSGAVMIKASTTPGGGTSASGEIHFLTNTEPLFTQGNASDNSANSNEIYMSSSINGLIRLTARTELSLGINAAGHSRPTIGIYLRSNEIRFVGYTAEQQYGIYARFA
jgi:hypothetical protein